jgi:hypothetical protein
MLLDAFEAERWKVYERRLGRVEKKAVGSTTVKLNELIC